MAAQRSHSHQIDPGKPPLTLEQLAEQQGLAGKPVPDYVAILRRMWPTEASRERTIRTLEEMDAAEAAREDTVIDD